MVSHCISSNPKWDSLSFRSIFLKYLFLFTCMCLSVYAYIQVSKSQKRRTLWVLDLGTEDWTQVLCKNSQSALNYWALSLALEVILKSVSILLLYYIYGCFAYIYICAPHICLVPLDFRTQYQIPLGLELQRAVNCHLHAENWNRVFYKNKCS